MLGKLNQLPHQSLNGVSRRKVNRPTVGQEKTAVPVSSIAAVTSQGHTCTPSSPAQQVHMQEGGNWKEAKAQLLRYQLAGQDQLLLLCPDLRQGQSQQSKESGSLGPSQETKISCGATKAICLHSVHPETIPEQL